MSVLGSVIGLMIVGFIFAAPFTVLLMLFLSHFQQIQPSLGFWDCFPGGMLLGLLASTTGKSS